MSLLVPSRLQASLPVSQNVCLVHEVSGQEDNLPPAPLLQHRPQMSSAEGINTFKCDMMVISALYFSIQPILPPYLLLVHQGKSVLDHRSERFQHWVFSSDHQKVSVKKWVFKGNNQKENKLNLYEFVGLAFHVDIKQNIVDLFAQAILWYSLLL